MKFSNALRNAVRRAEASTALEPPEGAISADVNGQPAVVQRTSLIDRLIRLTRPLLRPIALKARAFLIAPIQVSLGPMTDQLTETRLDLQQAQTRLIRVESTLEQLISRADDVSLKTRGPIDLGDGILALRTVDGFVLVPRSDPHLLMMLVDASVGGLEPGTRSVMRRFLGPGKTAVDIGAHIGLLTLAAARSVGPSGHVISIEASPRTFDLLQRGVDLNGLSSIVDTHAIAIAAQAGQRTFHVRETLGHSSMFSHNSSAFSPTIETVEVDARPLDDIISAGQNVDLIKIDVEGAELEVLAGMKRILAENPHVVLVVEFGATHLVGGASAAQAWFDAFAAHGFKAYEIDEASGSCKPLDFMRVLTSVSSNILFSPIELHFQ